MNNIYEYTDYRLFLKEYYEFRKMEDSKYTFRAMAAQMGFNSSNYLMLVMQGNRNVGKGSLNKLSKGLGFKKKESEYFSYLVFFDQAKTSVEKNYYFGLIASFRSKSNVVHLEASQFEFYSSWYNPVIRELIKNQPADIDYKELAIRLTPPILPKQAKKSVNILLDLNMIHVDGNGRFQQSSGLLNTAPEVKSLAVRNFHKAMCELAKKSIDKVLPEHREMSSITGSISERGFKKIKERIQTLREEFLQIIHDDKGEDRVYQLNFQFFPLSRIK